jgi:hypothetical protein
MATLAAILAETAAGASEAFDGIAATTGHLSQPTRDYEPARLTVDIAHENGGRGTVTIEIVYGGYIVVTCKDLPPVVADTIMAAVDATIAGHDASKHNPGVWRVC